VLAIEESRDTNPAKWYIEAWRTVWHFHFEPQSSAVTDERANCDAPISVFSGFRPLSVSECASARMDEKLGSLSSVEYYLRSRPHLNIPRFLVATGIARLGRLDRLDPY
jgi:hypothetical protein